MKKSYILLISLIMFALGTISGPSIKAFWDKRNSQQNLSQAEKNLLDTEIRDSATLELLTTLGPTGRADKTLISQANWGKENNLPRYTIAKLVSLIKTKLLEADFKACEHSFEALLNILKENPSIQDDRNIKDLTIIAYAYCLAGKCSVAQGNFNLADNRYQKSLELVEGISELTWLKSYIFQQQARLCLVEEQYENALKLLEKVLASQGSVHPSYGGLSYRNVLVNLCYLANKVGDFEKLEKYANSGTKYLALINTPKDDVYKMYFKISQDTAKNKTADPNTKDFTYQLWRVIMLNSD